MFNLEANVFNSVEEVKEYYEFTASDFSPQQAKTTMQGTHKLCMLKLEKSFIKLLLMLTLIQP